MTVHELIDISFQVSNRIDLQWGLFISVHAAILGAIVYIDRPLSRIEKAVALLMYFGFAVINYHQMNLQISLLAAVHQDIQSLHATGVHDASNVVKRIVHEAVSGRESSSRIVLIAAHAVMTVIVVVSILFDSKRVGSKS